MRFALAFITLFMLNLGYMDLPQSIYLGLILIYSLFSLVFLITDKGQFAFYLKNSLIFVIFFIIIYSYLKTNNPNASIKVIVLNVINWTICFFYFTNFILYSIRRNYNPFLMLAYSFATLMFLNLFLFLFTSRNISSNPDIENLLIKLITGISMEKIIFTLGPLSGAHAAILIVILSPFLFLIKNRKLKYLSLIGACISLVLLDNRMSLLALILSLALFFPLKKVKLSFVSKLIVIIIPFSVMIILVILPLLPTFSGLDYFSRNSEEILTANSRTLIWISILDVISTINTQTLFGVGDYGNLFFNNSSDYLSLFINYKDSSVKSSHNTYLQIILDKGYFFLILFYYFLINYLNNLFKRKNDKTIQPFIISIFIFLLSGTTEVLIGGYYFPTTFYLLAMPLYINNVVK